MFPVKYWQLFQEMLKYSVNETKFTCMLDMTYYPSLQPLKYKFDYVISLFNIITMFLCNFGTKADLVKMTSKAFHESAHCYFFHCISYLMPFKHIPHTRVRCLHFLECTPSLWLLTFQCTFLSGQGALHLMTYPSGFSWATTPSLLGWDPAP